MVSVGFCTKGNGGFEEPH